MCFGSPSLPEMKKPPAPPPPAEETADSLGVPGRGLEIRRGIASKQRRLGVSSLKIKRENLGGGTGTGGAY